MTCPVVTTCHYPVRWAQEMTWGEPACVVNVATSSSSEGGGELSCGAKG